ncbi:group 1 truncated hemoglobin [Paraglaciecola aquimarina]|uniref:Group 1 truncated hemoglobin n=1 Tax=Paraglaciecola algarum TaxID=3050085 RepID=A0ABS9DBN3_9ALTE|nr:group 1 truncated hemoglobin [Paraglaciecola sp. G1-23]MCF2949209.1 group 1 truncated hemoglobin [Paraglaciecola sp. G1-23]
MKKTLILLILVLAGCASTHSSIYQQMGGQEKVVEVVENFITEIEYDSRMFEYFKDSDVDRFHQKLIEHLCYLTGGPCKYTGDEMRQVHAGMNINEADFNHGVDLFINAMEKANISHPIQNKILAVLAPTRKDIIYL